VSDPRPPEDGGAWPERDLEPRDLEPGGPPPDDAATGSELPPAHPPQDAPTTEAAPTTTGFSAAGDGWDPKLDGDRRRPTTAEQAVPWLIGLLLALAGMVIVLLALIFSGPDALGGSEPSPTPSSAPSAGGSPTPAPSASVPAQVTTSEAPTTQPTPVVTPTPAPTYGPLEMVYLGRQTATAPIYLLRRDFSTADDAKVMAEASAGISEYAWAPDGTHGAAIISGRAVALTPGQSARDLGDGIQAVTFSLDSETVYAVRIVADGANDRAEVLAIDFASAGSTLLTGIEYPRPVTAPERPVKEAQYLDNGGPVRIYATNDGNLVVWILGAPATYRVDPADGGVMNVAGEPALWSPDGRFHIALTESSDSSTVITQQDRGGQAVSSVTVAGLVSHIRWAPTRNEIVFTLGQATSGGGVRQNLLVWDLVDGSAPSPLTSNGASFGADWLGVAQSWQP